MEDMDILSDSEGSAAPQPQPENAGNFQQPSSVPPPRGPSPLTVIVIVVVAIVGALILIFAAMNLITHPLVGEWHIVRQEVPFIGNVSVDYYLTFYSNGTGKTSKPDGTVENWFTWKDIGDGKVRMDDKVWHYEINGKNLKMWHSETSNGVTVTTTIYGERV